MNYGKVKQIPVVFHNGRGYDWHLLFQHLGEVHEISQDMKIIARNFEQYVSWGGKSCNFIDSASFYAPGASLEKLVDILTKSNLPLNKIMPNLCKVFTEYSESDIRLIAQKGIFPYSWFNSPECMNKTGLPTIEEFYNDLSGETLSDADYAHAQKVWKTFNCKTFRDYHDLYLRCDVAQLADVFESYRDIALNSYKIDPCHYLSAPNMAWDGMLKITNVELEQITDPEMYAFFEKGLRGGISMISHRYAKANNKYLTNFDPSKPSSFIIYLDANNLYGWAMLKYLPHSDFAWVSNEELAKIDTEYILAMNPEGQYGMTFEISGEYPKELHDLHSDYPLLPEKMTVPEEYVSPFNKNLAEKLKIKGDSEKLVPNLMNKDHYVVHYYNLQHALSLGFKLTSVHRAVKYRQSNWLESYINFNTNQRTKAKSDVEKDFYKLMNNSVFGKTMENVRNRTDIKVRNNGLSFMKDVCKSNFNSFKIFSENLVATQCNKIDVTLDKPIYAGQAVLDISKVLMYDFYYNFMKKNYGDRVRLLATDTDSLMFQVFTEDWYKDVEKHSHLFDLSEINKDDERLGWLHSSVNKKVVGKMKDETLGDNNLCIEAFVGLKPKMYALKLDDGSEKKTCKGIKKAVVKKTINFEKYFNCVMGIDSDQSVKQTQIRSVNHTINTIEVNKRSLCAYDTKRYILEDGINTLAVGHYKILSN